MKEPSDQINQLQDDLQRQQQRIRELERQLADMANGKLPESEQLDAELLWAESIVSSKTGEPFVVLRWFTHITQMPPAQAREFAINMLAAADAAESDAFLIGWLSSIMDGDKNKTSTLLWEFRQFRDRQRK